MADCNKIEDQILKDKKMLEDAQAIANLGNWEWNIQDNSIMWSDEVFRIFGEEEQSFAPNFGIFLSYVHKGDLSNVEKAIDKSVETKEKYKITHRIVRKDGSIRYLKEIGTPLYDAEGTPTSMVGVVQDITDDVEMKNGMFKMDSQLIQQSRLAQMGEMISMIAHQWRQPLGTIASTSIDMKMKSELDYFNLKNYEEAQEYEEYINKGLTNIDELVQNLTTTIDDFRNFYKVNKKSVNISLEEVILKSLNIIKTSLINDNIYVVTEYNSKEKVDVYDGEMMQVVLNILKNAQDNFNEQKVKNPKIIITVDKRTISICDNGGGIPVYAIKRVFDPYFSTKSELNGTGLGLYMSKTIVEEHHNGKLLVENIDDGVCFTIKL